MIQILKRFHWTWMGLLVTSDDYGLHAAQSFQSDLAQYGGGCLAYLEVVRQNVTGLQWIASEAWTAAALLQTPRLMPYLSGTLGIAIRRGEIPGLRDFLLKIHPDLHDINNYENSMCRFAPPPAGWVGALCTGDENLENVETEILDVSNLRPEYNVYKAVYALAYALDDMLQCVPGRGPFSGRSCATLQRLEPWQLVHYLQKVNFTTPFGDQVSFDENGDALPVYDIMNWLWLPDGRTKVQNVGEVKKSAFKAFVPAYVNSPGKYADAVEVFAILASSFGLLVALFGPKCYIILLRPERNTKKALMGRGTTRDGFISMGCTRLEMWFLVGCLKSTSFLSFLTCLLPQSHKRLSAKGFRHAQTMAFAVNEINRNSNLLPNVTLGYSLYDNCVKLGIGFRAALSLVSGQGEEFILEESCVGAPPVLGIVGDSYSQPTIAISTVLGLYRVPMVVKQNVTGRQWIASEAWTAGAVLQTPDLMPYLGGTLGIAIRRGEIPGLKDFLLRTRPDLHHNNSYGNNMCRFAPPPAGWVESGRAICTGDEDLENVETELLDVSNLRPEYNIYKAVYALAYALDDMLQCVPGRGPFSGRSCASLQRLEPWQPPRSVCSESCPPGTRKARRKGQPECCFDCIPCSDGKISNMTDSTECTACPEDFWSSPQRDHCAPKKTEFLSYHEPLGICLTTTSLLGTFICAVVLGIFIHHRSTPMVVKQNVTGRQWIASEAWTAAAVLQTPDLMPYLGGTLGIAIRRGEIPGLMDFLLRIRPDLHHNNSYGNMINQFWEHTFQCRFAPPPAGWMESGGAICTGDEDLENVDTEFLDLSNLRPEYNVYKAVYALAYALDDMLQCVPGRGPFSRHSYSTECTSCPEDFWSNPQRDYCVAKKIEFLSYHEPLGICLKTTSLLGTSICAVVLGIFIYHRSTPMVRANNSELSFLLLVSLKLCFLCSLLFIGSPRLWTCQLRHAAFGISFVLCVSCILVKTMVVLAVFKASKPGGGATLKWFGAVQQRGTVLALTSIQAAICTTWLVSSSPAPHKNTQYHNDKIVYECVVGSTVGFAVLLGYIGLLAILSFLLAFLARNLPDNFNEAKLITFSMLIFCAVWVAFVPAYVNSPGKYADAVEVFAILASSFGLLVALFGPKCFIILLRPERNTKKAIMGRMH
eukprot:superscaffoldBa00005182_g20015